MNPRSVYVYEESKEALEGRTTPRCGSLDLGVTHTSIHTCALGSPEAGGINRSIYSERSVAAIQHAIRDA